MDPYGSEAVATSVVDRHHFDAESDPVCHLYADPDPTFYFESDPDPSFQIKVQNIVKVFKLAHILFVLACHLQN
jgi:hypothetical protein